jgi:hypothetical protein
MVIHSSLIISLYSLSLSPTPSHTHTHTLSLTHPTQVISLNADKCVRDIVLSCQHREVLYALFGVLQEEIKNGNEQEKCVGYLALILKVCVCVWLCVYMVVCVREFI